jgi:hypothetical protein
LRAGSTERRWLELNGLVKVEYVYIPFELISTTVLQRL